MKGKIKITRDIFDISHRLKSIDRAYDVYFDKNKGIYEVYIGCAFCFKIGWALDNLALKKAFETHVRNKFSLIEKMEHDNALLEKKENDIVLSKAKFDLRNMFDYASKTGKNEDFNNINLTKWF